MANDMIRMSGMNSGLDTESIINALTANTKLKATKQERNVLKLEAQQEAYRDVISKLSNLKKSYFDILNKESYLSGASIWNKYSSKAIVDGTDTVMAGVNVETTINSQPGEYNVKVVKNAKQASIKGGSLSTSAKLDASSISSEENKGKDVGITVTVGDEEKVITFKAGADKDETIKNINDALTKAFGKSNNTDNDGKGMVYVDSDGSFKALNGKGITVSGSALMREENTLDFENAKTGRNTLSFQVGGQTLNVSFQTIEKDYFKDITETDENGVETGYIALPPEPGDDASDEDKAEYDTALAKLQAIADEKGISLDDLKGRASIAYGVQEDIKEGLRYDAFKEYVTGDNAEANKLALYNKAEAAHKESFLTNRYAKNDDLRTAYEAYKEEAGEDADSIYKWVNDQYAGGWDGVEGDDELKAKLTTAFENIENEYNGLGDGENTYDDAYFENGYKDYLNNYAENTLSDDAKAAYETYKNSLDEGEEAKGLYEWATDTTGGFDNAAAQAELADAKTLYNLSDEAKAEYEEYKSSLGEGETAQSVTEWASSNDKLPATVEDPVKSFDAWKEDKTEANSFRLSKDLFYANESKMFSTFKSDYEDPDDISISSSDLYDRFTETALKNSIGNLEASDGTKFDVTYADGKATITATKDGEAVNVSMTVGRDSVNNSQDLQSTATDATTSISQITNKTKLSDLGAAPGSDGSYSFIINDRYFSFSGDTTVNEMMKTINASDAGIKMKYSSLSNEFTVTANDYGLDSRIDISDMNGLLSSIGISSDKVEAGNNLEVEINGTVYETEGNSIEFDGTTITVSDKAKEGTEFTVTVERDTSAVQDLIKKFVEDYNNVIKDVYKYLDEKPEKDYYFLADADKEELDLSDKQEEKWEEKAKKGLLYHDSITSSVMTAMRTSLMGSVTGLDGNTFSLASLGITTATDYSEHGKLVIDEKKLQSAIENNADDIQKLFSDAENGIMKKFSDAIDSGIATTGDNKGSLIRKAGLATGRSALDNELYRTIKNTKTRIASLNKRYENDQNRLWKRYSSMESLLGQMNSQQASFNSYFMQ